MFFPYEKKFESDRKESNISYPTFFFFLRETAAVSMYINVKWKMFVWGHYSNPLQQMEKRNTEKKEF